MLFVKSFLVATVGAVIGNLIVLFIFRPFVIIPSMPLHALRVGPVVALTVIGVIGATIVYALMRKFLASPNKYFIWVSVFVLIVSFIPDYLIIGQTTGPVAGGTWPSALVLMLMHVVAAVISVWALIKIWGAKPVTASPVSE